VTLLLALASGALIGLVLGLVGGGGSILAVPLLVYVVGIGSPHAAIGTAAVVVAAGAALSLIGHWRSGSVKWRCAGAFALAGVIGAAIGAEAGKAFDGQKLLVLFGILMIVVGALQFRSRDLRGNENVQLNRQTASRMLPRLAPAGLGVGMLAGFFGIGGGFLIVPALMRTTGLPIRNAIGSSLVVIIALGATSAASYAWSGHVDWPIAGQLILGAMAGAAAGIALGKQAAGRKALLETGFALLVIAAGTGIVLTAL
jgi:uncharacterized protein